MSHRPAATGMMGRVVRAGQGQDPAGALRALFAHASETLMVVDDAGSVHLLVGPPDGLLGRGDAVGCHLAEHMHAADVPRVLDAVGAIAAGTLTTTSCAGRARHADGSWRTLELELTDRRSDPRLAGIVVRARDVTDRAASAGAGDALVESLTEVVPEPIVLADHHNRLVFANAASARLLHRSPSELCGGEALAWVAPAERAAFELAVRAVQEGATDVRVSFRAADAEERWVEARLASHRPEPGLPPGWVASLSDVSATARLAERQLYWQATHDGLTGLLNRMAFEDRAAQALNRGQRARQPVSLVYIDLTGFKAVNDSRGHRVGDSVLAELGRRLAATVREGEAVGRLGGDEFAIVCEHTAPEAAAVLADRVADRLSEPVIVGGVAVQVGADTGVASSPPVVSEVGALIDAADHRMYRSKRARAGSYDDGDSGR